MNTVRFLYFNSIKTSPDQDSAFYSWNGPSTIFAPTYNWIRSYGSFYSVPHVIGEHTIVPGIFSWIRLSLSSTNDMKIDFNANTHEYEFYQDSCPQAEQMVPSTMHLLYKKHSSVAQALLRLLFHDCFIQGCDAAVLLDSTSEFQSEKDTPPNRTLKGFHIIETIKSKLEEVCPATVSCADILVLSASEGVALAVGPSLPTGRHDSFVLFPEVASYELPSPHDGLSKTLTSFASSRGFDEWETVSLLKTDARETLEEVMAEALSKSVSNQFSVKAVCLAVSGVNHRTDQERILNWLRDIFPSHVKLFVQNDAVAALASGTLGKLHGCVRIAGMRTISYGFTEDGREARAAGAGPILGGLGSGYGIAAQALTTIVKAHDGRGPLTMLTSSILSILELSSPDELIGWTYADPSWARIAALVHVVVSCAEAGDPVAIKILQVSVQELAESVKAVVQRLGLSGEDLLTKDYNFDHKFILTIPSDSGMILTASGATKDDFSVGDISTQYKSNSATVDVKVDSCSNVSTTVTMNEIFPSTKAALILKYQITNLASWMCNTFILMQPLIRVLA